MAKVVIDRKKSAVMRVPKVQDKQHEEAADRHRHAGHALNQGGVYDVAELRKRAPRRSNTVIDAPMNPTMLLANKLNQTRRARRRAWTRSR